MISERRCRVKIYAIIAPEAFLLLMKLASENAEKPLLSNISRRLKPRTNFFYILLFFFQIIVSLSLSLTYPKIAVRALTNTYQRSSTIPAKWPVAF